MHPVMLTIPGLAFKFLSPALILWGLYSLIVYFNRRGKTAAATAGAGAGADAGATDRAAAPKSTKPAAGGSKKANRPKVAAKSASGTEAPADAAETDESSASAASPRNVPGEAAPAPPESPANALISVAIGIGLFLFAAPVRVPEGSLFARALAALVVFGGGVVNRGTWSAQWQSLPIYSYGVMLGSSLVVGWFVTLTLAARQGMPKDKMADCYVFTAFSAIIGSRVLYILTNLHEFEDPQTRTLSLSMMLQLRSGGLVAYGGFLGGLFGSIIFLRRNNLSLWKWADAAVPSLATGLMITRLGCYMYGCDFGKPLSANAPAFLRRLGSFPHWADDRGAPAWQQHVAMGFRTTERDCLERVHGDWRFHSDSHQWLCHLDRQAHASVPVHPTQLYESLTGLALFVTLMWLWRRRKFDGQIFLAFGFLYGFARSGLEIIRDDHERGFFMGLSTSQLIGLSTGVLAIIVYVIRSRTAPPSSGASLFGGSPTPQPA